MRRRFVRLVRAGGSLAEPTEEFPVKYTGHVVRPVRVREQGNNRADFRGVLIRWRTACKQPYWICLIDCTLNGGDKVLVAYARRVDVIQGTGPLRTGGASSVGEGHGTTEMTVTSPHSSDPDRP